MIITDTNQSQITIWYPGAQSSFTNDLSLKEIDLSEVGWAIVAPDNPERMGILGRELIKTGIPYLFDPSQQIASMKNEDMFTMIKGAKILIVNEYESDLICRKIGVKRDELISMVPNYIETHGEKGCMYKMESGEVGYATALKPKEALDPTGCGDAFRSGVLSALIDGKDLKEAVYVRSKAAVYNVECRGTQNHRFSKEEFEERQ